MPDLVRPIFVTTELEARLTGYVRRSHNIAMETVAAGLITAIDDLIQSEGEGRWDELMPSTIKRHPRRAAGQLLQDTGLLAQIQVTGTGPDWVEVESPAPYSWYHVEGTKHMVARDFLAVDLGRVLEQAADEIGEEIAKG